MRTILCKNFMSFPQLKSAGLWRGAREDAACEGCSLRRRSRAMRRLNSALEDHREPEAAGRAERQQAGVYVFTLHLRGQLHDHARAGCPEGVTDRDRAAVDIEGVHVDLADGFVEA